jgi:hypothetical protein
MESSRAMKSTAHFLMVLTLIQFWWIAIWGIAYILIDAIAGPSKVIELWIYGVMLCFTMVILYRNPEMLHKL